MKISNLFVLVLLVIVLCNVFCDNYETWFPAERISTEELFELIPHMSPLPVIVDDFNSDIVKGLKKIGINLEMYENDFSTTVRVKRFYNKDYTYLDVEVEIIIEGGDAVGVRPISIKS